jgi:hypothetical protein
MTMTDRSGSVGMLGRMALVVAALGLLGAPGVVGDSLAAFSDTTNNPGNSFSAAASFCTNPGTQTLIADADAYVDENAVLNNYGASASLHVQSRAGGRNRRTLVHFPAPAGSFCTVTAAALRLWATSADGGRTLHVYELATIWTETTVTWATQPLAVGTSSTAASTAGWVQFDVTAQAQSLFGGLNTGLVVKDSLEGQNPARTQQYSSREAGSYRPELVITLA